MKTVMVMAALGAALVVACLLTTVYHHAKNEFTPSVTRCSSPEFSGSDAATWVAKVRHDNCTSADPAAQPNTDTLLTYA